MQYAGVVLAYILGSTPFAYFAGRLLKGIDLRQHGSGNLGATNVFRTLGAPAGVTVFVLDALKGALPVLLFPGLFGGAETMWWPIVYGLFAIVGHVRPYAGLFKGGGKGVATAGGVFAALAPIPFAISIACFALVVMATRYVSLGSLTAGVVLTVTLLATRGFTSPVTWVALAVCGFVFWTHRANISRLREGTESRIGRPKPAA
ncbi:MAG: glycerol-3-phosphate 1-O-acyltransferase PlsY [Gemmatimonadaceae bacterium]